jgi:hypothetical protein
MPGVEKISAVPHAESRHFESRSDEVLRRPSPSGDLELEFSHPGEIGMGGSTWGRVKLLDDGRDVTVNQFPSERALGASVCAIDFYYPWDRTGTHFTLPLIGRKRDGRVFVLVVVYDLSRREVSRQQYDIVRSGVVWSPTDDRMLLTHHESAEIIDLDGHRQVIPFASHAGDGVFGAWTPDGRHVILSAPPEQGQPEQLQFVDAKSGRLTVEVPCDPLDLLPFDEAGFNELASGLLLIYPEDHNNPYLRWDPQWSIEALMHHWADALYEASTSTLTLSTFRPTFDLAPIPSPPRPRNPPNRRPNTEITSPLFTPGPLPGEDSLACVMTKEWVKITLGN